MVRLGIIGRNFVVDWMLAAAESVPALRPVAIYSRRLETGREFAQAHGLPLVFDRLEDLASCPEVDAVYIASPTGCHYDQARQMLLAGKHVLCEKPRGGHRPAAPGAAGHRPGEGRGLPGSHAPGPRRRPGRDPGGSAERSVRCGGDL